MQRLLLFILIFAIAAAAGNILSLAAWDYFSKDEAKKEIPFSHRQHVRLESIQGCESCHAAREDGTFMTLPSVKNCTGCHSESDIFSGYKDTDIPWESYAKQKKNVYFPHKVVITAQFPDGRKKVNCFSCHGNKEDSWNSSMITGRMSMKQCVNCHETLNLSRKCMVCH